MGLISKHLEVPKSTVQSVIAKYKRYGTTVNPPRTGRPKISARLARKVQREIKKNPRLTRKEIQSQLLQSNVEVSLATVSNTLHRVGMIARRPRKTPLLKANQLKAQLKYARTHVSKPCNFWWSVL